MKKNTKINNNLSRSQAQNSTARVASLLSPQTNRFFQVNLGGMQHIVWSTPPGFDKQYDPPPEYSYLLFINNSPFSVKVTMSYSNDKGDNWFFDQKKTLAPGQQDFIGINIGMKLVQLDYSVGGSSAWSMFVFIQGS